MDTPDGLKMAPRQGTARWMSPETMLTGKVSRRSDVYSFGMTMYEVRTTDFGTHKSAHRALLKVYSGVPPFANTPDSMLLSVICDRGMRPPRPTAEEAPTLEDAMWALIAQLWVRNDRQRPKAQDVATRLESLCMPTSSPSRSPQKPFDGHVGNTPPSMQPREHVTRAKTTHVASTKPPREVKSAPVPIPAAPIRRSRSMLNIAKTFLTGQTKTWTTHVPPARHPSMDASSRVAPAQTAPRHLVTKSAPAQIIYTQAAPSKPTLAPSIRGHAEYPPMTVPTVPIGPVPTGYAPAAYISAPHFHAHQTLPATVSRSPSKRTRVKRTGSPSHLSSAHALGSTVMHADDVIHRLVDERQAVADATQFDSDGTSYGEEPEPRVRTVRFGYWNRRGDHLVSVDEAEARTTNTRPGVYVVYAPGHLAFPRELAAYPDPGVGYQNHNGQVVSDSSSYMELPQRQIVDGWPPVRPYESVGACMT